MIVSLIAAVARRRIIGIDGRIPWDIPADRRRFRELTMGHPLVMGRNTFISIGMALPGRRCIVLSRQAGYEAEGCEVAGSIDEALALCRESDEVFIAGGADIYRQALPLAQRLYISHIELDVDGDASFPGIPEGEFRELRRELLSTDPPCTLVVYERLSGCCKDD